MNNIKIIKIASIFIAITAISGCASIQQDSIQTEENSYQLSAQLKLSPQQRADIYEAIIAGELSERNKDYLSAMSYYLFAAEVSQNQKLIEKSLDMAQTIRDPLGVEQAVNIWLKVSPDNLTAKTTLLYAQLEQENIADGLKNAHFLLGKIDNPKKRYDFLEDHVLNKQPRVSFNLLRELNNLSPKDNAIITAQAKFIFNMANSNVNKQSDQLFQQASARIEDALVIDPLFSPAVRLKTHLLFQSRRDSEAQSYLQNLFLENPDSAEINQMLGQLLYDLKDYHASIRHHQLWLDKHPKDLEARNYLAASYYALGQYQQSLANFKLLLGTNYQTDTVAFYCGDSAQKLALLEQAIECYSMVKQDRFVALSKIKLSQIYVEKNQLSEALNALTAKYEVDEKDQIRLKLAEIDLLKNHFSMAEAKNRLELALEKDPENIALLLKKIDIDDLTKQPTQLNQLLIKARDLFEPGAKLDNFNLAVATLLKNNHHYQLALDWLNAAIKAKPNDKELLYTRALYKEPLGLYQEMIKDFKALLVIYPDDLNIKNALGYTLADINQDLDYAQALIDSAYQGLPNNVAVIDSKGWVAFRQGQIDAAEEYLSRAFKLSPSPEGAAHLAEILWVKKEHQLAKDVLREGIKLDSENKILLETIGRLKIEL